MIDVICTDGTDQTDYVGLDSSKITQNYQKFNETLKGKYNTKI